MTNRRRCSLILSAVLLGAFALTAGAQERRLTSEPRDLARTRPVDRLHADGFTPLHGTSGGLLDPDDRRTGSPLPGVAWTPGLPGGGGGSGGDQDFHGQNSGYTVEVLPGYGPDDLGTALGIAEGRQWISGFAWDGCSMLPTVWEREPGDWVPHALPGLDPAYSGYAEAVSSSGMAIGYVSPCLPDAFQPWPVIWTPTDPGEWTVEALPALHADDTWGVARGMSFVPGVGQVIVGTVARTSATDETERAVLWHGEAGSWTALDLGALHSHSEATSVNRRGVVLGWSDDASRPLEKVRPFMIVPRDIDLDGRVDWFHDEDGDGRNDLMEAITPGPRQHGYGAIFVLGLNQDNEAVGWLAAAEAPPVTLLQGGAPAIETPLPVGDAVEVSAEAISDSGQIVGMGSIASGNEGHQRLRGHHRSRFRRWPQRRRCSRAQLVALRRGLELLPRRIAGGSPGDMAASSTSTPPRGIAGTPEA